MLPILFVGTLFLIPIRGDVDSCTANYLHQYGYLNVSDNEINNISEDMFRNALKQFQEYYKLNADGIFNEETSNLTKIPRCGVQDDTSFAVYHHKWDKQQIVWHYPMASDAYVQLAKAAFNAWSEYTNLVFRQGFNNPDIVIINTRDKHRYYAKTGICPSPLDGSGKVLAHAEFPAPGNHPLEIHIDNEEDWYLGKDGNHSEELSNFYRVLLHEIGHTLGISHSRDDRAVMYSLYLHNGPFTLQEDDILALQSLYGIPENRSLENNGEDKEQEEKEDKEVEAQKQHSISVCDVDHIDNFLIVDHVLFLFSGKLFWMIDLSNSNISSLKSQVITDWIPFLPSNMKTIDAIYRRPSGEIAIFIGNRIYMIDYPSLAPIHGYPKRIEDARLPRNAVIQAAINTYSGRTYIFYSDVFVVEMDECRFEPKEHKYISTNFPTIPTNLSSAFRYTNGLIYFFKGRNYYEYSEFNNTLVRAGPMSLSLVGIHCSNPSILSNVVDELKGVVSRLENIV
jgi:predicted Zn-dependent protease